MDRFRRTVLHVRIVFQVIKEKYTTDHTYIE